MASLILAEDGARVFLYKEAGIPVFPPHRDPDGDCLLRRWRAAGGGAGDWPSGFEGGLAHRLDTATSGIVVAARTPEDLRLLREQFSGGLLRKHYRFASAGEVPWDELLLRTPIAHHPRKKDRMVLQTGPRTSHRGKWYPAWTRFRRDRGWTAEIRTGVMHQVRVHAAGVGLALTGDLLYGGAPGPFLLVHVAIAGPGWASPVIEIP